MPEGSPTLSLKASGHPPPCDRWTEVPQADGSAFIRVPAGSNGIYCMMGGTDRPV
jgi:hypothetical protein